MGPPILVTLDPLLPDPVGGDIFLFSKLKETDDLNLSNQSCYYFKNMLLTLIQCLILGQCMILALLCQLQQKAFQMHRCCDIHTDPHLSVLRE